MPEQNFREVLLRVDEYKCSGRIHATGGGEIPFIEIKNC
jgi:hypothetical protein